MNSNDISRWIDYKGEEFLRYIGIKKNDVVLDFGCRYGTYSLPAAKLVGKKGKIYAIDKKKEFLDKLLHRADNIGLNNIEAVFFPEEKSIPLSDEYIDVIILYDVLHLIENREKLLKELNRVLKSGGILSVFPKHHDTEMKMDLMEIQKEIEVVGFIFGLKIFKSLMHDDQLEKGLVLNFKKI
jgi:ubiquinone/menaquinone biosynthesis C-methylase UbiE